MLRLGGPEPHGRRCGVVHIVTDSEQEALDRARTLASLLGAQGTLDLDAVDDVDLAALLPESPEARLRRPPAGRGDPRRGHRAGAARPWAPNIVTALGRLGGRTVGVIANNPLRLGGCLDSLSRGEGRRGSCGCATRSACRWSWSSTCPATCPASARSGTASCAAARSCCTPSASASCRG